MYYIISFLYIHPFLLWLSPEQSGKVVYLRERLGIANKLIHLLAIPSIYILFMPIIRNGCEKCNTIGPLAGIEPASPVQESFKFTIIITRTPENPYIQEPVVNARQLASVAQLVRALHRNHRASGSIPARAPGVAFFATAKTG